MVAEPVPSYIGRTGANPAPGIPRSIHPAPNQ